MTDETKTTLLIEYPPCHECKGTLISYIGKMVIPCPVCNRTGKAIGLGAIHIRQVTPSAHADESE